MRNMKFDVVVWPKKDTAGVTKVSDEHILEDGTTPVIEMGELTKTRGEIGYRASVLTDAGQVKIKGLFSSRSKAGHAVRQAFEKDIRSEKAAARTTAKSTKQTATKQTATKAAVTVTVPGETADETAKREKRNARKRELRAAKKASA